MGQQETLCFTHTEFAPPFMGYLHGPEKMGRRERESIKHGCLAYWLGYWREVRSPSLCTSDCLGTQPQHGTRVFSSRIIPRKWRLCRCPHSVLLPAVQQSVQNCSVNIRLAVKPVCHMLVNGEFYGKRGDKEKTESMSSTCLGIAITEPLHTTWSCPS